MRAFATLARGASIGYRHPLKSLLTSGLLWNSRQSLALTRALVLASRNGIDQSERERKRNRGNTAMHPLVKSAYGATCSDFFLFTWSTIHFYFFFFHVHEIRFEKFSNIYFDVIIFLLYTSNVFFRLLLYCVSIQRIYFFSVTFNRKRFFKYFV